MANYVTATFTGGETKAVATGLWQWDYGQTLRVEGLNLPRTLEVHFHQRSRQWLMYGVTVDGVMTVSIPNEFLQYAQPVVAYIYLHDAETDGETQYEVTLPVVAREKPVDYDETDPATTAAYQALVDATALLQNDIETVQGYADDASDHATAAEGYAINAEDAAAQAAGSAQTANASAQNADQSAQDAAQSAQEAAQTVQTVEDAAEQVAADKAAVEAAADTFTETTVPNATAAVQQEGAIQIAAINAAGTTQTGNVNSAGSTQTAAVNAAGATQIQAVTAKGEEYIEEIDTLIEEHIDDTLTQLGMAADAKKTGDEITDLKDAIEQIEADKADTDGTYPGMTVGMAEQLDSDNYTEDSEPYHFRKSGGGSVRVGEREVDEIVGGTVAWNQLVNSSVTTMTVNGITFTQSDGAWNISGTATGRVQTTAIFDRFNTIAGHKYLVNISKSLSPFVLRENNNSFSQTATSTVRSCVNSALAYFTFDSSVDIAGSVVDIQNAIIQIIDLTAMFGSTIADYIYSIEQSTAGAGVAFLRRYIDIDTYHPYDAGTLKSVEGLVSHDMVGFNQWDEEWEVGGISSVDGSKYTDANRIRSKNYIPVLSNTQYYFNIPNTFAAWKLAFYDADKNFINYTTKKNNIFTTPTNCAYMMIAENTTDYGTTYNHDICINLSDPAKNGTYEPYEHHSYPLDSTVTLRGVYKLVDGKLVADGDEYASDGTVARAYNKIVLDGINITAVSVAQSGSVYYTIFNLSSIGVPGINTVNGIVNIITNAGYREYSGVAVGNIYITNMNTFLVVCFFDQTLTTVDAVNTYLQTNPLSVVYKKGTPTTETAEPFTNPQWVDGSGTEQYVSTSLVPIGHYTQYPEDLKSKIEGLPWDFASLIAPTESTYKATRAYSTGNLFIINNILYKATTSIASGATITPNTNCTATTLAAVIAAL